MRRGVFASLETDNGRTSQSSYFYGLLDSNGDETSTGYYVRGESFDKTQFPARVSPCVHRLGKGPTRPNFRGTAIMTVIFLHLEERAHFLCPRVSPIHVLTSPPFSLRRRRECPAPAILLKPTATIAPYLFFLSHLFAFPQLVPTITTLRRVSGKLFNEH